jgi:hypothetical protein
MLQLTVKNDSQLRLAVIGAVLDPHRRAICAKPLCYRLSSRRRPLCGGALTVQARVSDLTLYARTQYVPMDKGLWSEGLIAATHAAPVEIIDSF